MHNPQVIPPQSRRLPHLGPLAVKQTRIRHIPHATARGHYTPDKPKQHFTINPPTTMPPKFLNLGSEIVGSPPSKESAIEVTETPIEAENRQRRRTSSMAGGRPLHLKPSVQQSPNLN